MDSKKVLIALTAAVAAVSCHDYRDDQVKLVPEQVYLSTESTPVRYISPFEEDSYFAVIKSGKGLESAAVEVSTSATGLVKYNEENGTRYVNLPGSIYDFPDNGKTVIIKKEQDRAILQLDWDDDELCRFLISGKDDYVIPLKITNSSASIAKGRDLLLLHPVVPSVGLRARNSREIAYSDTLSGQAVFTERILLNHPIPTRDLTVSIAGASAEGYASTAEAVPQGAFTLLSTSVTIEKGQSYADFSFRVDYDKFLSGNAMATTSPCVTAVRITGISIDYLPLTQEIMYIPFRYQAPKNKR